MEDIMAKTDSADGNGDRSALLSYPRVPWGPQLRTFEQTPGIFEVVAATFFPNTPSKKEQ